MNIDPNVFKKLGGVGAGLLATAAGGIALFNHSLYNGKFPLFLQGGLLTDVKTCILSPISRPGSGVSALQETQGI